MKIAIWGNELIGWTAAAAFAEFGNQVFVNQQIEGNASLDEQAETSEVLLNELGLLSRVEKQHKYGNIHYGNPSSALECDVQIIALDPDKLPLAESIIAKAAANTHKQLVVINYATFGLGSTEHLATYLQPDLNQGIAFLPNQLVEGSAYNNFVKPHTLVIGCEHAPTITLIQALYKPFTRKLDQMLITKVKEAEFMKFAVNGMLALRLGYINELANLADHFDIDIDTIIAGIGSDPRIGKHYLAAGCGFGGAHFSKSIEDMANLLKTNRNSIILNTLLEENEKQKTLPFRKLWQHYNTEVNNLNVAIWGLSFKPETANIQNAPSIKVVETLLAQGCNIKAHDPKAIFNFEKNFPSSNQLTYCKKALDTLNQADALIIMTEWNEYWSPDYEEMLSRMHRPVIIDGRNILDKGLMQQYGFTYYGIGR